MAESSIAELLKSMQPTPAQVGLGAAQAFTPGIISLFSRGRRRSHEQRAEQLQDTNREKRYGFGLANLARSEGELLRQQERAPSSVRASFAGIGASGGSQEAEALRDQEHQFRTRMAVLNQQRAELKWGKEYGDEVRSLQDSISDLANKEAKVNAIVQTALEVAKAAATGGASAAAGGPLLSAGMPGAGGDA